MTAPTIAATETAAIRKARCLFLTVLVSSALCVTTAVFFYLQRDEAERFHDQFESFANKLVEAIEESRRDTLGALGTLVMDTQAYVDANPVEWPFVTLPDFVTRAQKTMSLSLALQVAFYVVVERKDEERWEQYASENNQWVRVWAWNLLPPY